MKVTSQIFSATSLIPISWPADARLKQQTDQSERSSSRNSAKRLTPTHSIESH